MDPLQVKFWIFLIKSVILFGFFLISALGTYKVFTYVVDDKKYTSLIFSISLVLGPVLLSWVLGIMLQFFPGQSRYVYIYGPLVLFFPFAIRGINATVADIYGFVWNWLFKPKIKIMHILFGIFLGGYLILSLGGLITTNAFTPLYGNDALEYSRLARFIAEARSVQDYPLIDNNVSNGFIAGWTHPLGYINLLTYGYLFQGMTDTSGVTRFVAPYFAFALTMLMISFAGFKRKISGLFAAFFLLSTPLFYTLVVQSHIDPIRIATFSAAIASVWVLTQKPSLRVAIFAGTACGCSMFTHSIGILTLPLAIPIYVILVRRAKILNHLFNLSTIIGISTLMLTMRYTINFKAFGSFIGDRVEVWEMPEIEVEYTRVVTRFMETPLDKIYNGVLMGFSNTGLFGWFYFILLGALALWVYMERAKWKPSLAMLKAQGWREDNDPTYAALLVVMGYTGIMFLTLLMGTDLAIKNARYILTLQPFVIMVGIRVLALYLLNDTDYVETDIQQESYKEGKK